MFRVQPVRSKELQKELSELFSVKFYEDTYAFFTVELNETADTVIGILGLCQFEYTSEKAVIRSIAADKNHLDDEAIFIMVRTVMNFCYRAEISEIKLIIAEDSDSECELLRDDKFAVSLGFRRSSGYSIDLRDFYRSPCHYNSEK